MRDTSILWDKSSVLRKQCWNTNQNTEILAHVSYKNPYSKYNPNHNPNHNPNPNTNPNPNPKPNPNSNPNPKIWNSLPSHITDSFSFSIFKMAMKRKLSFSNYLNDLLKLLGMFKVLLYLTSFLRYVLF